ncbi:MAG: hypothetical protein WBA17_07730 [Saprospiraceae bacterium]
MSTSLRSIGQLDAKLNRKELRTLARQQAEEIIDQPRYDLFRVYVEAKRYETYLKGLLEVLRAEAYHRVKREPKHEFKYGSGRMKFGRREKFDFSPDPQWREMTEMLRDVKQAVKEREQLLKTIRTPSTEVLDEATGEVTKAFAPRLSYVDTVVVRFAEPRVRAAG